MGPEDKKIILYIDYDETMTTTRQNAEFNQSIENKSFISIESEDQQFRITGHFSAVDHEEIIISKATVGVIYLLSTQFQVLCLPMSQRITYDGNSLYIKDTMYHIFDTIFGENRLFLMELDGNLIVNTAKKQLSDQIKNLANDKGNLMKWANSKFDPENNIPKTNIILIDDSPTYTEQAKREGYRAILCNGINSKDPKKEPISMFCSFLLECCPDLNQLFGLIDGVSRTETFFNTSVRSSLKLGILRTIIHGISPEFSVDSSKLKEAANNFLYVTKTLPGIKNSSEELRHLKELLKQEVKEEKMASLLQEEETKRVLKNNDLLIFLNGLTKNKKASGKEISTLLESITKNDFRTKVDAFIKEKYSKDSEEYREYQKIKQNTSQLKHLTLFKPENKKPEIAPPPKNVPRVTS